MKERPTAGYYLLRGLTWIVQLFPLRFHYMVSDFFYLLVYHVIRYRRTVVYTNLRNSFPEKSPEEISAIARKFYHHFCDNFFETLYMDRISPKEVRKRLTVMNEELLEKYLDDGRIVIFT
ncbi:MAG: lipid A biosynthesis acyltransferase, partial [Marinilabiliales bacterium]|nr:lipid A biosynthesis acyltransferase [Marinilabiliales bacterium]